MASRGYVYSEYDDGLAAGDNKVIFADKAKFKDNYSDVSVWFGLDKLLRHSQTRLLYIHIDIIMLYRATMLMVHTC